MKLKTTCVKCRCQIPHGALQGQSGGINCTALAAIYPKLLCRAILYDLNKHFSKLYDMPVYYGAVSAEKCLWFCPRCRFGVASGKEHTRAPGCKYRPTDPPGTKPSGLRSVGSSEVATDGIGRKPEPPNVVPENVAASGSDADTSMCRASRNNVVSESHGRASNCEDSIPSTWRVLLLIRLKILEAALHRLIPPLPKGNQTQARRQ